MATTKVVQENPPIRYTSLATPRRRERGGNFLQDEKGVRRTPHGR
jgi:hypothetical protein